MISIQAMPDELLVGFRARLARVQGVTSSTALDRKLVAAAKLSANETEAPVVALTRIGAAAAHCSDWEFLMRHSNAAVNAPVDNPLRIDELGSPLSSTRVAQIMSPGVSMLRVCPGCVQKDLTKLGFSYWRRSHHIPGRYVCEAHGMPLRLAYPELPLSSLPQDWIDASEAVDEFLVQNHHHNPYVGWYLDHMDQVAAGVRQVKDGSQRTEIYSALKSWRRSGAGWVTQLACLITDAFTLEWLSATVSRSCCSIDGVATTIVRPILYPYMSASQSEMAVAAGLAFARNG